MATYKTVTAKCKTVKAKETPQKGGKKGTSEEALDDDQVLGDLHLPHQESLVSNARKSG